MEQYKTIKYEKNEGVALITLNRPHALNAISRELTREFNEALEAAEGDEEVRVLIITGAPRSDGRPCFSAGADIKELVADRGLAGPAPKGSTIADEVEAIARISAQLPFQNIYEMRKPIIAAIDGICTAAGLGLAEACDIRLVAETAEISDMHIKNLGFMGGGTATAFLPRIMGASMAKEMAFTGEPMNGIDAWQIGFANHVYPSNELMQAAMQMAKRIATMDPGGIRMAKVLINASVDMDLRQALMYSRLCSAAYSPRQGFENFANKREERESR